MCCLLRWDRKLLRRVLVPLLLSVGLSISLFPVWQQIYTYRNVPVVLMLEGQDVVDVRVYWDDPTRHPDAYEQAVATPLGRVRTTVVDTAWRQLQVTTSDGKSPIPLQLVRVRQRRLPLPLNNVGVVMLPVRFWNRLTCAIVSSFLSFCVVLSLFLSVLHLWRSNLHSLSSTRSVLLASSLYIAGLSITISGFWLLIFYPGYMTLDSLNMWSMALESRYTLWYPPSTAMMLTTLSQVTGKPDLYAFLQGVLFLGALLGCLRLVVRSHRLFVVGATVLAVLLPSLWIVPVTVVNNVNATSLMLLGLACLIHALRHQKIYPVLIAAASFGLMVCFRRETIVLILLPMLVFCRLSSQILRRSLLLQVTGLCLIVVTVVMPSRLIEHLPSIEDRHSPRAEVFMNQYAGTLYHARDFMSAAEMKAEQTLIDQRFGANTFNQLIDLYQCKDSTYLYTQVFKSADGNTLRGEETFVMAKVADVAWRYPRAFLQHKLCNWSYLVQGPEVTTFYTARRYARFTERIAARSPLVIDSRLPNLRDSVFRWLEVTQTHPVLSIAYRHYIFLSVALLLALFGAIARLPAIALPAIASVLNALCLMLPDGYANFRYLLPSYVGTWIAIFAALDVAIQFYSVKRAARLDPRV